MGLFKKNPNKKKETVPQKQKEEVKNIEQVKKRIVLDPERVVQPLYEKICQDTQDFIKTLNEKGIFPTWGFEERRYTDKEIREGSYTAVDNVRVYNVPLMRGVVFDDQAQKCVYFTCAQYLFCETIEKKTHYDFNVFGYKELLSVNIDVDNTIVFQSQTSTTNTFGRAVVGGIIGGGVGAIVAGASAPQTTATESKNEIKKIGFNLCTSRPEKRTIDFLFCPYINNPSVADRIIANTMNGIFSNNPCTLDIYNSLGTFDCRFIRNSRDLSPSVSLNAVLNELKGYARKIEAIILSNQQSSPPSQASDSTEDKLLKLKSLLEKDLITQEEYQSKKAEVLKDL